MVKRVAIAEAVVVVAVATEVIAAAAAVVAEVEVTVEVLEVVVQEALVVVVDTVALTEMTEDQEVLRSDHQAGAEVKTVEETETIDLTVVEVVDMLLTEAVTETTEAEVKAVEEASKVKVIKKVASKTTNSKEAKAVRSLAQSLEEVLLISN